ncbi:MAG: HAMP domain-containing histidine kinase [Candidatus Galacturonibacter soehngenii]|nr:HAMP domain-containing histidine kinase [Candidatus Galacturonibacter soehngenii]
MKEREKNNRLLVYILLIFIIFSSFSIFLILIQYKSYEQKLEIIYQLLVSGDNIDVTAQILKGYKIESSESGKQLLETYGYRKNQDALYDDFVRSSALVVIVTFSMFGIVVLILYYLLIKEKKARIENINEIEELLKCMINTKESLPPKNVFLYDEYERVYESLRYVRESLTLLTQKLEKEKEATKALVTDISHQLKTPVAALKTSLEILEHSDLSQKEREEFMNRSIEQVKGIENLLEALIQISRMETGMIEIRKENQNIFDTVLESVNRIYVKAQEKKIKLEMEAEDEMQQLVLPHDKKWLCESFINILDNAVKYSPSNTCITIRLIKMVTFLRIEFEDEGMGIPKEEYNQIFKRFYRGIHKEVKKQPGSGIGLYLSREIIDRHNGTISVFKGLEKKGTRIVVQIPYKNN